MTRRETAVKKKFKPPDPFASKRARTCQSGAGPTRVQRRSVYINLLLYTARPWPAKTSNYLRNFNLNWKKWYDMFCCIFCALQNHVWAGHFKFCVVLEIWTLNPYADREAPGSAEQRQEASESPYVSEHVGLPHQNFSNSEHFHPTTQVIDYLGKILLAILKNS